MEKNIKILIADENDNDRRRLADGLRRSGFHRIDEVQNGEGVIDRIAGGNYDIVIVDVWLSKLDGIGILRQSRAIDFGGALPPLFIVTSSISSQNIFVDAMNAGAALCLLKPIDPASLAEHLQSLGRDRAVRESGTPDIETQVTKIIHQIGVPAHIKGYQYLRTAILLTIRDSDVINSVTKVLYPTVAKKYQTTTSRGDRGVHEGYPLRGLFALLARCRRRFYSHIPIYTPCGERGVAARASHRQLLECEFPQHSFVCGCQGVPSGSGHLGERVGGSQPSAWR